MKAAWYESQGPAESVLIVGDMPDPQPGAGEVRLRLQASGINPGDVKKRSDDFGVGMPFPRVVPHSDGSGVIDSLGEGVSALAIIVSLLYVGYEFRRTNTMSSREADVALYERLQDSNRMRVETPGLAEILVVYEQNAEDLSDADRLRLRAFQQSLFETWELGWHYHEDGILSEDSWAEWDRWFSSEARRQPVSAW